MLVVLGHNNMPNYFIKLIYAFHIPLFFFLSGYVSRLKIEEGWLRYVLGVGRKLIIPYVVFNVITYLYWVFIDQPPRTYENVVRPIVGMLYGIGTDGWLLHNNALWFLTCLFVVELFFGLMIRVCGNVRAMIVLGVSGVFGYFVPIIFPVRLPWGLDVAFVAVVFYGGGYLAREFGVNFRFAKNSLFVFSSFVYLLVFSFLNGISVDMNSIKYGNFFYFYFAAVAGIVFVISVSQYAVHADAVGYIGRNSLLIFGLHILAIKIFKNQFGIGLRTDLIESVACAAGEVGLLIPVVAFYLYMKKISMRLR